MTYEEAKAEAQRLSDADGYDRVLLPVQDGRRHEWSVRTVPAAQYRIGDEVTGEIVHCSIWAKVRPGHAGKPLRQHELPTTDDGWVQRWLTMIEFEPDWSYRRRALEALIDVAKGRVSLLQAHCDWLAAGLPKWLLLGYAKPWLEATGRREEIRRMIEREETCY